MLEYFLTSWKSHEKRPTYGSAVDWRLVTCQEALTATHELMSMNPFPWLQLSTLATLGSWSSLTTSPFLFLRPFIFLVFSLDRSCFCMCTRPNEVPKTSWEMFFFFFGCSNKNNNNKKTGVLTSELSSWTRSSSWGALYHHLEDIYRHYT